MSLQLDIPVMCGYHQSLLIHHARYKVTDPWKILIIATNTALLHAAMNDPRTFKVTRGDLLKIKNLPCLACFKTDAFYRIIDVAKSRDIGKIKELGESWKSKLTVGG